jgi:hypothetical protein
MIILWRIIKTIVKSLRVYLSQSQGMQSRPTLDLGCRFFYRSSSSFARTTICSTSSSSKSFKIWVVRGWWAFEKKLGTRTKAHLHTHEIDRNITSHLRDLQAKCKKKTINHLSCRGVSTDWNQDEDLGHGQDPRRRVATAEDLGVGGAEMSVGVLKFPKRQRPSQGRGHPRFGCGIFLSVGWEAELKH